MAKEKYNNALEVAFKKAVSEKTSKKKSKIHSLMNETKNSEQKPIKSKDESKKTL